MSNSYTNINSTGIINGTLLNPGTQLVYSSGTNMWDTTNISIDKDLTSFFELVLVALGHDIKFEDFKNMSDLERNQILRDIKLKTIL